MVAVKVAVLGVALTCTRAVVAQILPVEFEAASVKVQKPAPIDPLQPNTVTAALPVMRGGPGTATPGRIHYSNVPLMSVIMKAYGLHADQVAGPGWLREDHYAIDAVVPSGATAEQFLQMLRNLLVSRFQLAVQWEERDFKIYRLVVAEGGVKLKPSAVTDTDDEGDPLAAQVMSAKAGVDSRGCPCSRPPAVPRLAETHA